MNERFQRVFVRFAVAFTLVAAIAVFVGLVRSGKSFFVTADQQGWRLLKAGEKLQAAETFGDPMRRGAAYYRAGEFKKAAATFASLPGAEAAFNHGNSLVMMGKYKEAELQFDIAIESRPDWQEAIENRELAIARGERIHREGGNSTDGMLGADDIVFTEGGENEGTEVEVDQGEQQTLGDQEMQAVWLRQVETTPSQFLKAKFAYQRSARDKEAKADE